MYIFRGSRHTEYENSEVELTFGLSRERGEEFATVRIDPHGPIGQSRSSWPNIITISASHLKSNLPNASKHHTSSSRPFSNKEWRVIAVSVVSLSLLPWPESILLLLLLLFGVRLQILGSRCSPPTPTANVVHRPSSLTCPVRLLRPFSSLALIGLNVQVRSATRLATHSNTKSADYVLITHAALFNYSNQLLEHCCVQVLDPCIVFALSLIR